MTWRSQHYRQTGNASGADPMVLENAIQTSERLQTLSPPLPPVLTLNHLSKHTGVPYHFLRSVVEREKDPYKLIRINKRPDNDGQPRFRIICIPTPKLLNVQRWIDQNILNHVTVDEASVGFSRNSSIKDAASIHCGARWLIKLDIKSFFESITEIQVYRILVELGYQPLVSLEMARLCTRMRHKGIQGPKWGVNQANLYNIVTYNVPRLGYLPQGAATSPKLSNIAMIDFDQQVRDIAKSFGLVYTRYADDLTLSTMGDFNRGQATRLIGAIYTKMRHHGFSPQMTKTKVVPPGARKIVLGLGVDSYRPRLTKAFKEKLRRHIFFLTSAAHGPAAHAANQGNATIYGLRNHVQGLLGFAKGIDPGFAKKMDDKFKQIEWP